MGWESRFYIWLITPCNYLFRAHELFLGNNFICVCTLVFMFCFQKLKLMLLKKDDTKTNSLMSHLRKINEHLGRKGTRFLTGDTMCCFDCELMPRLQHIRVAGDFIKLYLMYLAFIKLL